jgi:hypothetical protein
MTNAAGRRSNQAAHWILVVYLAVAVAFGWQKMDGAYESEFGGHPDEAAHYVTGLFVHDALAALPKCITQRSLQPLAPFKGKEGEFYQHYPKVALGVWPPAFYVVQSAWTFLFGVSRWSILLLMAMLAGAVASLLYRAVRTEFGTWPAAAAGFLWLCSPLVRESYGMVMAEMLSTLTMFGATLAWGRFLDDRRGRDAIWFGVLAGAAIMTKGTGMALALMCLLSVVFARRWWIFSNRMTWVAAALVLLIAGPWTWFFRAEGTRVGGWEDNSGGLSWAFTREALVSYGQVLGLAIGVAVGAFALIGWLARGFGAGPRGGRWAALGGLVLGVYVFQSILPVGLEARHLISVTPALVMLAVAGLQVIARSSPLRVEGPEQQRREHLWVVLLLLLTLPMEVIQLSKKGYTGFASVAEYLLANAPPGSRILVSSDARGEGMFISEVAMHDRRPNLFIERASNSLVDQSSKKWNGRELRDRFLDDEALLAYLTEGKINYIVLDDTVMHPKRASYQDQLKRVVADSMADANATGHTFWKVDEFPMTRENEGVPPPIRLYRVTTIR